MAEQDDIAASLPRPPPPSPARREQAIEAAMRRFDGAEPVQTASSPRPMGQGALPWWARMTRPRAGVLISAVIVAAIAVPLAMDSFNQWPETRPVSSNAPDRDGRPDKVDRDAAPPAPSGRAVEPRAAAPPRSTPDTMVTEGPALAPKEESAPAEPAPLRRQEMAEADLAKPAAPAAVAERNEIVVTAMRREETLQDVPMAVTVVGQEAVDRVTVGRRKSALATARGDWNACTVNDPDRSLRECGSQVKPAAKGARGRADASIADGLSLAWKGNVDAAITAFDRAIEADPRHAFAYLNRGLAYRRKGDPDRALADLNQAVRYSGSARAYYNRSLLLREQGNTRRARSDEQRAVELDPRYADVLR